MTNIFAGIKKYITLLIFSFSSVAGSNSPNEEWDARYDKIINEACSKITGQCLVRFSAYKEDDKGLPLNNLDEIALEGKVVVIEKESASWHPGKSYRSSIIINPTWQDLCRVANEIIKVTDDHHHKYLESFHILEKKKGIILIELFMGS